MGHSAWGHLDWGCLSPPGVTCRSTLAILPLLWRAEATGWRLARPSSRFPCKLSASFLNFLCLCPALRCFLFILLALFSALRSFRIAWSMMVWLPLMAGYRLAFRASFSKGFQTVEWEILGETLQSFMSYQKHFIWELRSLWCTGGGSHCPHSRALFSSSLTAGRTWSFESKCFSYRIRAIHGEANPSLTVGKGCVVCGSLNTCLMVNSMPRVAYRVFFLDCYLYLRVVVRCVISIDTSRWKVG